MSEHLAMPEHEVAFQDVVALMHRHRNLKPIEILAIAANVVGKLVALQDQLTVTPAQAMAVVTRNLEMGNRQVIEQLAESVGRA